eukprot:CAMPEP_0177792586 /NCGR_PEP_ID=MMETSP0491_2-20121128/24606_1 /TAXON_ID=63592 /ORGANISM="Tetraselmis chuii, Strain PLY429" /LENGTH=176 /DNA_ID=CAMNT_0019315015 /DNA_START=664 /DNA_END=1190 /DNA_ORIENTATION=-
MPSRWSSSAASSSEWPTASKLVVADRFTRTASSSSSEPSVPSRGVVSTCVGMLGVRVIATLCVSPGSDGRETTLPSSCGSWATTTGKPANVLERLAVTYETAFSPNTGGSFRTGSEEDDAEEVEAPNDPWSRGLRSSPAEKKTGAEPSGVVTAGAIRHQSHHVHRKIRPAVATERA